MNGEELCSCGYPIPRGYGYYNYLRKIKCINCGNMNQRTHIETPEELYKKLKLFVKSKVEVKN